MAPPSVKGLMSLNLLLSFSLEGEGGVEGDSFKAQ